MLLPPRLLRFLLILTLAGFGTVAARAEPIKFDIPAQPCDAALLAFSKQTNVDVLFSFDELHRVQSNAVEGLFETEEALSHLLRFTGYLARRNGKGKYVVTLAARPTGTIRGRLLQPDGSPAAGLQIMIQDTNQGVTTDETGVFTFGSVLPGLYQLVARGREYRPLSLTGVKVGANRLTSLRAQTMQVAGEVTLLEPFVVKASSNRVWPGGHDYGVLPLRVAAGNLDLPRSIDDALAFQIYTHDQLARSGVINLNEFLQRELLDSTGATPLLDTSSSIGGLGLFTGSTNLNLRGFRSDETVILVNGRRLPEVMTSLSPTGAQLPDVNFIPLSMVQQVEVLPVSAASLYTGNPVGGVINIVLRPDLNSSEVTATYSNALGRVNAPQSSVTLQNGQTLLGGALRLRISANFTRIMPATEAQLGYIKASPQFNNAPTGPLYRATPNVRSADGNPLFGPGTPSTTSVAPGADGTGGLASFAQRQGVLNRDLFQVSSGGLVTSPNSSGFAYGQEQQRSTYYGSVVYDVAPWLQLGLDGTFSRSVTYPGRNLFTGDLTLAKESPFNHFEHDVLVSLNESAPLLGEHANEARLDFSSVVMGVLFRLPSDWKVALDAQYAHTVASYRGLSDFRPERWQALVDLGLYNPLRDTQVYGPPQAFYDQVLVHYGTPGSFVTLGNYQALDAAIRITNQALQLPTGLGAVNFGGDYRRNQLASFIDRRSYGDGSPAFTSNEWTGRTLERLSSFGELQAPLVPQHWLPPWLRSADGDLAVRYITARSAKESYFAPTLGLKLEFAGGLSFRSSLTTSSRYPTPYLSQQLGPANGGGGVDSIPIIDPRRNGESYTVQTTLPLSLNLNPETAVTQTAGLIFQQGTEHRFRATLDFFDTRKVNEQVPLSAQQIMDLEAFFPGRVTRTALQPGDTHSVGRATSISPGTVNLASRHSQNWDLSLEYAWTKCLGGTLALNGRLVYFQRYNRKILPTNPVVDELAHPDSTASNLLKYRATLGAGWSNRTYGFGLEEHYYSPRILPLNEQPYQGSDHINPYWQSDVYLESDLTCWLPGKTARQGGNGRYGLHGQLRFNNVFAARFPRYGYDSITGVQPYGDWRGRTCSLSLTATF